MGKLNINIGAKLQDVKTVQSDIQAQLEKISSKLGIQIDKVKVTNITGIRSDIQEQINQVTGKLTMTINSVKISASALKQLKQQLSNQALNIKANVKTETNSADINKQIQQTSQSAQKLKNDIGAINTQALDHIHERLRQIQEEYGEIAKKKVNFNGAGEMTSTLLTYKNSLGQVVQETYAWKKANEEQEASFGLIHSAVIKNYESIDNLNSKMKSLRTEAEGFIQSFKNNGKLNNSFIADLSNQLDNLGRGENLKKAKQELADFVSYLKKLKTSENQIITLQKSMDKLAEIKSKLIDGKKIELMTTNQVSAVQQVDAQMSKMASTMEQLQNGATKTSTEIRTLTTASSDAGNKLKMAFDEGTASVNRLGTAIKTIAGYIIGGGILLQGIQAIKNAFSELTQIDKDLIDISRVASESLDLSQYTSHANKLGMTLNQTTDNILQTAYAVQKLGYDLEGSGEDFLKWSAIFSNVGDINIDTAMTDLVTILKGFNMEASESEHIIDAFNNVSNNMAVNAGDIGEAFKSSASNLHLANTSLEESIGLITGGTEVLQDASRVGNGLKTVSLRVQGYSEKLRKLGVDTYDAQGKLRSLYDIMMDASRVYNQMASDADKYSLLETLGGKQQAAVVASIITNIDGVKKAYELATNSAGSAMSEQERYMESLDAKINALKENLLGMWLDISNSGAIKGLVDNVNELVTSLRNSENVARGFSTAFNGISSILNGLVKGVSWLTDKFGLFATVVAGIVVKLTLTNTKFKNFADTITSNIPVINKIKDGMTNLGVKLLSSAENTQEAINAQKQFMAQADLTGRATANASLQLVALNAKMALCKVGAIALQGAILALNTLISAGLTLAIGAGISAINNLLHAQENLKQSNDDYLNSLKNGDTFNASGAEKALASYKKLSQELSNLTPNTEEYKNKEQELVEVKNQLIDLLPETEQLFANSAEAKGLDTKATEELIEKEKELAKAKAYDVLDDNNYKDKSSVQKEILEYEALQEQIKLANKLREEGKKTGYANVSKDYNGSGKLATTARDAEAYAERLEQSESKLRAFYEAMNQLDGGSGKFSEEMKMISDTLGIVEENLQNTTDTANNTDLSNVVDQFEEGAESADNFKDAVKELQDSFSGFQDGIDLLQTMIEEFQQYGQLTQETMEKALTSGDENIIATLKDSNTFLEKAIQLQDQYRQKKEETKNAIIDQAYAEVEANGQTLNSINEVNQAYENQANVIERANQMLANREIDMPEINIGTDVVDKILDEYGSAINEMIGMSDNLSREMVQAIVDYVNQGGQLYAQDLANKELYEQAKSQCGQMWKNQEIMDLANMINANADNYSIDIQNWANAVNSKSTDGMVFEDNVINQIAGMITANAQNYSADTVNWASAITNKDSNNVMMVNSIIQAIAQMILANSQNYSADTVAWAEAINNKDANNAQLCSGITQQMAQAINNMNTQYLQDVQNFQNACNSKIAMYNSIASKMQSINNSLSGTVYDGKGGDDIPALNQLKTAQKLTSQIANSMQQIDQVSSGYSGASVAGIQVAGMAGASGVGGGAVGGNYVGGNANKGAGGSSGSGGRGSSGGSGGRGSSGSGRGSSGGSGSVATEREVADMESLVDIYSELEKAISKTNNELDLYATLQKSANGQEAVKYIELQIGAYRKLQKQEEELLRRQQARANELKSELQSKGFNIDNEGMIANYESQLKALEANANALSGEQKTKEIERVKELNKLIEEYNQLVSKELGSTKKEIADINNQVKELYKTKLELVSKAESNIYDVVKYYAEKQVDAQKEALEKVQKARKKMREDDDYERNKAEKIKDLADLESQIEILSKDGSRAGQQKLAELKQQYADLMNDLNDVVQDNQDKLFDDMIDNETNSLEEQLKQFLDPTNINRIIADAMNSGMVSIFDQTYNLQQLTNAWISETEIGITNATVKMNEYCDAIRQAQSAYVDISSAYPNTGMDGTLYNQGQNYSSQISGNNNQNIQATYVMQFPENINSIDRETIENIVQPMLDYSQQETVNMVTNALNGK